MSFNSFRQHLYRFFSKKEYEDKKDMQQTLNNKVLGLFQDYGGKSEYMSVEFFFYTDTQDKANNLAIELAAMGYEMYGADKGSDDKYSIIGCTMPIGMHEESVTNWSKQMCKLGYDNDCQFDGWGTLIE